MTVLMALDASTTTIGIAIFSYDFVNNKSENVKLTHLEYHKPNKKLLELDWIKESKNYIMSVALKYKAEEFAIEEYIKFMKGASGASTVIPLAIWNRTLCLAIYEKYNYYPSIINVMKIRHALKFDDKIPSKEDMPEIVAKHLGIDFPYEYKVNKKTQIPKILDECFDMADAGAVGLTFLKIKSSPAPKVPKKKKKAKKSSK